MDRCQLHLADADRDRGSAVVEFAMVSALLVLLLFAVLQIAAVLYVRSVAGAAASDGARYGAGLGVDPVAGGYRAEALLARGLGSGLARQLPCTAEAVADAESGLASTRVTCHGRIRSVLLPIGAFVTIDATGQSLAERP